MLPLLPPPFCAHSMDLHRGSKRVPLPQRPHRFIPRLPGFRTLRQHQM